VGSPKQWGVPILLLSKKPGGAVPRPVPVGGKKEIHITMIGGRDMGLYDFTVYDMINRNAAAFGRLPAWFELDDGRTLSFAAIKSQVDGLAAGLREMGLKKGDRIGVLGKNSLEFFLIYGAAAGLGLIVLPVNWRLSAEESRFNLNDCTPRVVFADLEFQSLIEEVKAGLPSVERFFNLKNREGGYEDFNELVGDGKAFEPEDVATDDGFVIIHTAAVAGRPRGALLSHGNVLWANMHFNYFCGLGPSDVHLNLLPLFHVGGLFMATSSFHAGALNVNMSKFDAALAVALIEEKKVSFMFDFSPILSSILDEKEKAGRDISSLKTVVGLESPDTINRYQEMTGGSFFIMYGQTETSCLATFGRFNECPGSAGRALPMTELVLVDDNDRPIGVGEIGEIAVRGPMVFKGYWELPEDTDHTFRNGRHHTGDLGRFDENGFLWYEGRKAEKELIKPGGENVYPAEVENAIMQHPAVAKVVVFGVPDPKWKEGIKAVCLLREGESLEPRALIDFVGERIARYKKPQYLEFVTDFPLLENGMPDREKIKGMYK